jgi:hypothetical protein
VSTKPIIEQRLKELSENYGLLCAALGHVKANLDKLQKEELQILARITKLDEEAGLLKLALNSATKSEPASES